MKDKPLYVVDVRKSYREPARGVVYRTRAGAVRAAKREARIWDRPMAIMYDCGQGRFVDVTSE